MRCEWLRQTFRNEALMRLSRHYTHNHRDLLPKHDLYRHQPVCTFFLSTLSARGYNRNYRSDSENLPHVRTLYNREPTHDICQCCYIDWHAQTDMEQRCCYKVLRNAKWQNQAKQLFWHQDYQPFRVPLPRKSKFRE